MGEDAITIGADASKAGRHLDCPASKVQKTIRRCKVKAAALPTATSLGRKVDAAAITLHFEGQAVNMALEFSATPDAVLAQLRTAFGKDPGVQYWADDERLYASYVWVDKETEVELTRIIKGTVDDGKVRVYVSSILSARPLHPDDVPAREKEVKEYIEGDSETR